jgi:toxin ParE1/3/4
MSLSVVFLSGADADLQSAFNQFEDYHEGFSVEFMQAVEAHLSRAAKFPLLAPIYVGKVRRLILRGFPYGVFYEPQATRIIVVAILDLRQDPQYIQRRLQ